MFGIAAAVLMTRARTNIETTETKFLNLLDFKSYSAVEYSKK